MKPNQSKVKNTLSALGIAFTFNFSPTTLSLPPSTLPSPHIPTTTADLHIDFVLEVETFHVNDNQLSYKPQVKPTFTPIIAQLASSEFLSPSSSTTSNNETKKQSFSQKNVIPSSTESRDEGSGEANTTPSIPTPQPRTYTAPQHLEPLFNTFASAFNVDPNLLKHLAKCESGFRHDAVNGPYGGMFQYLASTWSSTRNTMGLDPNPDLRFNAQEAIKTTAFKISIGGLSAWPHCSRSFSSSI